MGCGKDIILKMPGTILKADFDYKWYDFNRNMGPDFLVRFRNIEGGFDLWILRAF